MRVGLSSLTLVAALAQAEPLPPPVTAPAVIGGLPFADARNPPAYTALDAAQRQTVDLGHAVFNTQFLPAGAPNATRYDGLGPMYNASSCDACHNEGARGRGPSGDGPVPAALLVQLERRYGTETRGDPVYGETLTTTALPGMVPEGRVTVNYTERVGRYADGTAYRLREPRYTLTGLTRGPIDATTLVEPRIAPALFGLGLLEAAVDAPEGRFGWQGSSASIREQTAKAFARDIGITSEERPRDDCTPAEQECLNAANGGDPEVSPELFAAVVAFQRTLAVPLPPAATEEAPQAGTRSFEAAGCVACHRPQLAVKVQGSDAVIEPFTDLRRHDLGAGLADRDGTGRIVTTRWRTAPLWGMAYRLQLERQPTFLHDGRARSIEEAILWHDGEARSARRHFSQLSAADRALLLKWLAAR